MFFRLESVNLTSSFSIRCWPYGEYPPGEESPHKNLLYSGDLWIDIEEVEDSLVTLRPAKKFVVEKSFIGTRW
ncbi:11092_t:CDS:2 [Paraglomus brasilianum]|uniref:11092_t:CDS:1 n=1 Tax=Paraglomus brasilianum TaxID=144538 RepID=A0A9N9CWS9_9GLOM|nr:11092_t:CDS:2 [Paraglomus brasilianum]